MPDTIVALATPTGRSGIGVIRISGDAATAITGRMTGDDKFSPKPRFATLQKLYYPSTNEVIDEAIVTYFPGPRSFTGEDVIEISCHGSPVLLRQVIDICLSLDARMAEPGEFTLRALSNGRIDLAEAEAIRDLIDAQTAASARQAARQMSGEMSRQLTPLKNEILSVIVVLESALEFVEDDLPATQLESVRTSLIDIAREIERLAGTYRAGHLIREGLCVAIVGRPNVGKSSLFNSMFGGDRAIVTDIAGTTRDQIHERMVISNIPISLIDTAGLRETSDTVESIGVERSRALMADADLVIVILDASEPITKEDHKILDSVRKFDFIVALNKIDKVPSWDIDRVIAGEHSSLGYLRPRITPVSAKSGEGIDALRDAIIKPFAPEDISNAGFLVSDARHHDLLLRTKSEIEDSVERLDERLSEEIVLIGLHNALRYLGDITGETTTEDMLDQIFATFCIGK
ncbi:MAG TPA: tRNA uridine-5-carboxymethylaminomethyl(34) synthesis GTPase MnmE [Pyrinomonadaceae bacterium]|nr:tRNA uridine-5-carboxymethylaminomethyl(34) synthesis GTPase MnmE [Chloracidobacterium sp.]MBP9934985.1 tRNA uridine-5-carboxymethylaminomethyl(34) synthesis GTPase MnmE [Pyrinomonadaceae bacterium]MBK7801389.1 tRNA uridine-5-carboxymethylaminomethyl(34) synthesis GTPase MnmE [Chloracidobacterium sp.]MBL0241698.1 tRNA uridine-5-carboxymethylaminomethyl(34) synthesis GTPase MnmE [Chloracidobacterium sp.]HQX54284.1 tRNA uridine-5-carboxymethylaminomethyl(34) synthesis GTPase MnmE [Pyrinomonada